jgi:hypothetical protein
MNVGDLVIYIGDDADVYPVYGPGIIMRFDEDDDPIVLFQGDTQPEKDDGTTTFYRRSLEVISENR